MAARQLEEVLVDSDGGNMPMADFADEALEHSDARRAFDKAPHVPRVGAPTVSTFNENMRADLLFSDDVTALRGMDTYWKYHLVAPVHSKHPQEVRDAPSTACVGVFGQLRAKVANRRMQFGRTFVRSVASSSNVKGWVHAEFLVA